MIEGLYPVLPFIVGAILCSILGGVPRKVAVLLRASRSPAGVLRQCCRTTGCPSQLPPLFPTSVVKSSAALPS